jgi:hypothetical protein
LRLRSIILLLALGFFCGAWNESTSVEAQPLSLDFKTSRNANRPPAARCRREDLSVKEGETDAAMGGVRQTPYIFTNISSSPCTLEGYPSVELLSPKGTVVRRSTKQESDSAVAVGTIESGKTAWFNLNYNSGGAGHMGKPCPTYPKIRIVMPGVGRALVLRSAITSCPRTNFEVTSIQSGQPN